MNTIFLSILLFLQIPIRFFQEEIYIKVYEDSILEVEGVYHFKNLTNLPVSIIMRYPFPVDKYHEYPFYIKINKNIPFERKGNDIVMPVNFGPFETKEITIKYKQKLKGKKARYILTTTRKWEKPLEDAFFKIEITNYFKNLKISYKPDSSKTFKNKKIFYIHKVNFFPEKDLVIEWKE